MQYGLRFFVLFLLAASLFAQDKSKEYKQGHSLHGEAFDAGPRQKPWLMEGIGSSHFPITTRNPEVQQWFDQGHTLLHSFWFYEAERAFRWCLKLEPDNAMAYWGLARAIEDDDRGIPMYLEAAKRKARISDRERLYIEAWEPLFSREMKQPEKDKEHKKRLEALCLRYPDDIEAKTLFALANLGDESHYGNDLVLQQVLAKAPGHPGAHHYRIHTWNQARPEYALDSCARYSSLVPGIGHALHMPGHIYSTTGMWHEAAIAMDAATRSEKLYMQRRLTFPFNNWNYAHNLSYLAYIQEQLGMAAAAIRSSHEMMAAPYDPKFNNPDEPTYNTANYGKASLLRVLVKYERWKEILDPKTFNWRDTPLDRIHKAYCEGMAHLGLGELEDAAKSYRDHAALKEEPKKPKLRWLDETYQIQAQELQALRTLARGDTLEGLALLSAVAKKQFEHQETRNDPPYFPHMIYTRLGQAYLAERSPALAVAAFEKTLERVRNDAFALSGLVEAYAALGEKSKAKYAMENLLFTWSDADAGLPWMERAKAAGVSSKPLDNSPRPQRNFRQTSLEHFGPNVWTPYEAPLLDAVDAKGAKVTLAEYRGKNVLLIFYLGEECPHCLEQLVQAGKKKDEFGRLNTEVLAISPNTPARNQASQKLGEVPFRLLSDTSLENARRFQSYDDFESLELHSTILIDKSGRVHWARSGGDPFTDFEFLFKEIKRLNAM